MTDYTEAIASYEAAARIYRPDWAEFVAEAQADVLEIAYEVQERMTNTPPVSETLMSDEEFDALYEAVKTWVEALARRLNKEAGTT